MAVAPLCNESKNNGAAERHCGQSLVSLCVCDVRRLFVMLAAEQIGIDAAAPRFCIFDVTERSAHMHKKEEFAISDAQRVVMTSLRSHLCRKFN